MCPPTVPELDTWIHVPVISSLVTQGNQVTQIVDELVLEIYNYHASNLCGKQGGICPCRLQQHWFSSNGLLQSLHHAFCKVISDTEITKRQNSVLSSTEIGDGQRNKNGRRHNPANLHASYNQITINLFYKYIYGLQWLQQHYHFCKLDYYNHQR